MDYCQENGRICPFIRLLQGFAISGDGGGGGVEIENAIYQCKF